MGLGLVFGFYVIMNFIPHPTHIRIIIYTAKPIYFAVPIAFTDGQENSRDLVKYGVSVKRGCDHR
jgi:hypothetical protein